jgi:hypothetical protein
MEKKVLTQEEIATLKNIQQERILLAEQFGALEIHFQELDIRKKSLITKYQQLKQTEESIGNQLQQKYGDGVIDLEKGEFVSN